MLISQVWVDLAEHDLAVSLPDARHVILTGPSGERRYLLQIHTRPPGPAQVIQAAADASTEDLPGPVPPRRRQPGARAYHYCWLRTASGSSPAAISLPLPGTC
jgi:hypothetical protein